MKPEDIQGRDFLVGLRGYDKDEVRSFLAEVAAEHAALLASITSSQSDAAELALAAATPAKDAFEDLGSSVATILRAAKESATEITGEASAAADELRAAAERYAADLRAQAETVRTRATESADEVNRQAAAAADELRSAAQTALDDAHAEAERIVREATEAARRIEIEVEAKLNNRTEEATKRESALRARLVEANDELQLALMALDGVEVEQPAPGAPSEPVVATDERPAWS